VQVLIQINTVDLLCWGSRAKMRESNTQIAVAAQQQSQVAEEMNRAVVSIRDELATLAGELNTAMGQLKVTG
jgi:methyl-accepting chemotaxis protein